MDRLTRDQVWQRAASRCEYCLMPQLTVEVLEINLAHRLMHRQALVQEGVFPPDE